MKHESVDFLFLVEHEDREGGTVDLLARKLVERGFSSLVISLEFELYLVASLSIKNVVFPYAIDSNGWPYLQLLRLFPDINLVSLNWEQLLSSANREFKKPKCDIVKNNVHHLAWYDFYSEFLMDSGVKSDMVKVIGNPLTELLAEEVKSKDPQMLRSKYDIMSASTLIFLPMNYGWAFHSDKVIAKKIEQGYGQEIALSYRQYSQRCLKKFVEFVYQLSTYSGVEIVIRPHPSISVEQYREYFERLPINVRITKEHSVVEWISASDYVGSSWSTTVFDSYNLGKKSFLFTPEPRPVWLDVDWNSIVPNVAKASEVFDIEFTDFSSISPMTISDDICDWLQGLAVSEACKASFYSKIYHWLDLRVLRGLMRKKLVQKFSGLCVRKGMLRDFFEARKYG